MANQFLNVLVNLLVYSDEEASNAPALRDTDYSRKMLGLTTSDSFGRRFLVPAGQSIVIADTSRSLSQDATTQYTVSLVSGSTYRFQWVGGTNPILRTQRAHSAGSATVFNVTKVGDVVRYTHSGVGPAPAFLAAGVVVGDQVTIEPFTAFNVLNQGVFTIVTVAASYIEVVNEDGVAESGIVLGAAVAGVPPMDIYSATGVQIGDEANIVSSAFNIENRGIYAITAVTSQYFQVSNGNPGIPEGPITLGSATGIVFYPSIYKWVYVESDQKISIRVNADTTDNTEVEPVAAGDPSLVGVYLQRGGVWKLTIVNNGIVPANCKVAMSE